MIYLLIILFAVLGGPLFMVMGGSALLSYMGSGIPDTSIGIAYYDIISKPEIIPIPLFTLAGYLMAESKTPQRLVKLAQAFVGWMPGGLAIVTILACAFFTAFTGASGVTIIALGGLLYPILVNEKYNDRFSMGLVTCCGSLGLLFPPSLPIILYGVVGQVNIDKLFVAGLLPGLLLIGVLAGYSMYFGSKKEVKRTPFKFSNIATAMKEAAFEIPLPIIVLGGMYSGFFTAIEASAVTALYVFIIEVFIYRDLKGNDILRVVKESMVMVGGILIILGVANGMTNYFIDAKIPDKIFAWMVQYIHNKYVFLVVLNIFLLFVGSVVEVFSAIIVVLPLIIPIATLPEYGFNIDKYHLAIIFLTNLEIGYLAPPVGLNLFLASFRLKKNILELYRAAIPYMILMLACLLIIIYVPQLSLFLLQFMEK